MRNAVILTSLLGLGLLAGCPDRTISEVSPEQGRVEYKDIPVDINRKVDILFVIDDSPSMADKQANLKANFPNFINVLNTIAGGLPDVHLGVVTSDLGSSGADGMTAPSIGGTAQGGCSGQGKAGALQTYGTTLVTGKYISDAPPAAAGGMRMTNYTGTLAAAFSAIASAGANGCGFEQHIEAAKRALQPTNTANAGFLRSEAYLAVIFVADEDDCSMEHATLLSTDTTQLGPLQSFRCTRYGITCDTGGADENAMNQIGPKGACHSNENSQYLTKISDYVTFFKGLKPDDPTRVIMGGIVGVTTPVETELRAPSGSTTAIPALAHSCTYTDSSNQAEVGDPAISHQAADRLVPESRNVLDDLPAGPLRWSHADRPAAQDRTRQPVYRRQACRCRSEHAGPAVRLLGVRRLQLRRGEPDRDRASRVQQPDDSRLVDELAVLGDRDRHGELLCR